MNLNSLTGIHSMPRRPQRPMVQNVIIQSPMDQSIFCCNQKRESTKAENIMASASVIQAVTSGLGNLASVGAGIAKLFGAGEGSE